MPTLHICSTAKRSSAPLMSIEHQTLSDTPDSSDDSCPISSLSYFILGCMRKLAEMNGFDIRHVNARHGPWAGASWNTLFQPQISHVVGTPTECFPAKIAVAQKGKPSWKKENWDHLTIRSTASDTRLVFPVP